MSCHAGAVTKRVEALHPSTAGATTPLELVAQHLLSTEQQQRQQQQQGQQDGQLQHPPWHTPSSSVCRGYPVPLGRALARVLYPVSWHYCSSMRRTVTYASLESYLARRRASKQQDGPLTNTSTVPWGFLAAAPAVTALSLHLKQVPALLAGPQAPLCSLTGRLTAVEVLDMQRKELNDLGRLLAMTTGLQVLRACGSLQGDGVQLLEAALVAGADASSSHGSSTTPDTGGDGTHSTQISSNNSQHLVAAAAAAGASSSSASGGGRGSSSRAPLPLLQLDLASLPLGPFHAWLQRRHQLGQLQSLALVTREGPHQQDMWACITAATGLRQLRLETEPATPGWGCRVSPAYAPGSLAALSSSLTHLSLTRTPMDQLQQDPGLLTQLRRLQLTDCSSRGRLCASWVTCLRQLTHLSIRSTWLQPLPEDLGKALPLLEVLVIRDCNVAAPPKGLTRLTRLEVAHNWRQHYMDGKLDMAAVCEATALRQLDLSGNSQKDMYPIQVLSQLEVLRLHGPTNMRRPRPAGNSPTPDSPPYSDDSDASSSEEEDEGQLPHLVNLRHLDLTDGDWWAGELLMIMQDLTFLSLAGWRGDEEHQGAALDDFGAMEGLQQLDLSNVDFGSQWVNACSWVGEHEQLTKLSLSGSGFSSYSGWQVQVQGVAQLPTQLVELDIRMEQMFELPECLSRLTNLRMLLVGGHMFHFPHGQLQDVLQGMQQLEALLIPLPPNGDVVELLVQLPQLRYLALRPASNADLVDQVFDRLPHLSRFSWYDNAVFAHACTHGDEW